MKKKKAVIIAAAVCIIAVVLLIFNLNSCSPEKESVAESGKIPAEEVFYGSDIAVSPEDGTEIHERSGTGSETNNPVSEEKNKKNTCLITINDGAASANTNEAVNGLHVYDPNSEEMEDYFSGMEVEKGTTVDIFAYNLASPVSLEIEHNGKTIATATVTACGKGNYTGTLKITFRITQAKNPMTVRTAVKTVHLSKVKKAKQTVSPITVRNARGRVTYTRKSGFRCLTVDSKTGKITVKKGTKAGTYIAYIRVAAAGDKNFRKLAKTVKVKIIVK